jgi:hypothetical protein
MATLERYAPVRPCAGTGRVEARGRYMGRASSEESTLTRATIRSRLTVPGVRGRLDSRRRCVTTTASASPRFQNPCARDARKAGQTDRTAIGESR